ncbi:MAG: polysaccharide biosynthesis tyrosine autokinase [Lachnospirales bacterium]
MNENNQSNQMINLEEIFFVMLKNIWLIILLAVVGYVGFYIYAKSTEVPTYTTSVSLYVKNTTNKTAVDSVSANDLSAAQTIAGTYIAVLSDDMVMETIGDKLIEKYGSEGISQYFAVEDDNGVPKVNAKSIARDIKIEQVNETELLKISVTTPSPTISADICTFITEYAPEQLIRVVGAGSVENVGRIKVPKYPDGSSVPSTARAGMLAGIVLAVLIIYLRYILDNTVNNGEILRLKYNIPVLAEVPFYDVEGRGRTKNKVGLKERFKFKFGNTDKIQRSVRSTIKDVEVPVIVKEAYNTFRTNIIFALSTNENKSKTAIITSPLASEGKSTSAANLAISIGQTESRVLLIDADLRKPTQHKLFKLKNDKGLSTLLSGMSSFDETVNKDVSQNLDVITSGPMPPNPSQMLTSEVMTKLLKKVEGMYDYVLIDSTPVNIVSDALILSKQAAGVILVTRHGITTFEQIDKVLQSIEFVGANILGAIVNSVSYENSKKGYSYYRYKYRYSYSYSNNDSPSTKELKIENKDEKKEDK